MKNTLSLGLAILLLVVVVLGCSITRTSQVGEEVPPTKTSTPEKTETIPMSEVIFATPETMSVTDVKIERLVSTACREKAVDCYKIGFDVVFTLIGVDKNRTFDYTVLAISPDKEGLSKDAPSVLFVKKMHDRIVSTRKEKIFFTIIDDFVIKMSILEDSEKESMSDFSL